MANASLEIDLDNNDCKTKEYLKITVDSHKAKLIGSRYYYDNGKIKLIENSNDLIGQTIKLRSPLYCKSKNGICPICYGDHWKTINTKNIGILAGGAVNVVAINALMKQKHRSSQVDYVEVDFPSIISKSSIEKTKFNMFLNVNKNAITVKQPCTVIIDRSDYSDESLIDAGEYFYLPGIIDICIDIQNGEFINTPFNFKVKLYKPTEYYEEGKIYTLNYQEGEKLIEQDYYEKDIDPATVDRLFGAMAKYITKPEILLDALSEKLDKVDLVHLELIISNMFRDAENEMIPARLTSYNNAVIVGQKKLPFITSWLTSLTFENIKRSLKFAIIDGKEVKPNEIEKLVSEKYREEG